MKTYKTNFYGDSYEMSANFGEASSPIYINGEHTGKQVADCRHSPESAMRDYLEDVVRAGGDNPDDEPFCGKIEAAIEALK